MSKAILMALGDELIAQGRDRSTVRRALASVSAEDAEEALADVIRWAEDVVESATDAEDSLELAG